MRGDRLVIGEHHTRIAAELVDQIRDRPRPLVVSVAGESGAGKSELGSEIARLLGEAGIAADVLQQDDYFVFPPRTNHEMRRRNIEQVGLYEVKLDFLDANCRSFLRGDNPIYKPLVDYDDDSIGTEERDLSGVEVVIAEGTYTTGLRHARLRVFIDRTFRETAAHRAERARDAHEPFIDEVLAREHRIIRSHRQLADLVVSADYSQVNPRDDLSVSDGP